MQSFVVILQCIVAIMCLLGDDTWIERNVAGRECKNGFHQTNVTHLRNVIGQMDRCKRSEACQLTAR